MSCLAADSSLTLAARGHYPLMVKQKGHFATELLPDHDPGNRSTIPGWSLLRRPLAEDLALSQMTVLQWFDLTTARASAEQWLSFVEEQISKRREEAGLHLRSLEEKALETESEMSTLMITLALMSVSRPPQTANVPKLDAPSRGILESITAYTLRRNSREWERLGRGYDGIRSDLDRWESLGAAAKGARLQPVLSEIPKEEYLTESDFMEIHQLQSAALQTVSWSTAGGDGVQLARRRSLTAWDHKAGLGDYMMSQPKGAREPSSMELSVELPISKEPTRTVLPEKPSLPPHVPSQLGRTVVLNPGTIVVTPLRGKIIYSGDLRGWGNVVMVDVGNDRTLVLAGLRKTTQKAGSQVDSGQPVGVAAGPVVLSARLGQQETGIESMLPQSNLRDALIQIPKSD